MSAKNIERLLGFGLAAGMMETLDIPQVRNQLLDLLQIAEPWEGQLEGEELSSPLPILEELLDDAVARGLLEDTVTERDILDAKIMAQLLPRQSELHRKFQEISREKGLEAATDFFYKLSQDANYIRMDRIARNKVWEAGTEYGSLEITINLSKPEKDPKEIAKAKHAAATNYPKCLLCLENVGFAGNLNHPARSNHRVLPLTLNGEPWYFQYSPYVYYNEHAIIFKEEHVPMKISRETFQRLLDFVELFPHYFVGSNADLPIVGGSILSHDHFQGGHHVFPMEVAKVTRRFSHPRYPGMVVENLKWPLSVVRASGRDKGQLVDFAMEVFETWKTWEDRDLKIHAFTDGTPHNTVTPIARINAKGEFELDLVLRNNRQDESHPDGIFHPHAHLHHIKKENIGLIEVMGLAVLPARLDQELLEVRDLLAGAKGLEELDPGMEHHRAWARELLGKYGNRHGAEEAMELVKAEVGVKFGQVLDCAGVYKMDGPGQAGLLRFQREGLGMGEPREVRE
ncbi:UDP-glucose--hexose-1-phosphate uridylyltransferase [Anaerotalea alkaliphila]|uniref:Galactose-1-phosphate uridylyltransferase n=1 Tax=Anaerotalea alkaliphila TaxID=2662126 RepID=A0A7X5HUU4_9FIRM|nr:UDP-glucose--hexose-1-phosphate uridylyltransferase [Anaerotalea alkaliphila]NDL67078.1 UDP-glucose--hexose-1-phosphate uridylyltransferase [Anaerotalea alkaliphila]